MTRVMVSAWVASAFAAVLSGCGESNGLFPVYGQVKYKGEPAVGATISFYPKGPDTSRDQIPRAEVESDGSFRLVSGDLGSGAAPGQYAVLVEWRQGPLRTHRVDTARTVGKAAAREGKPLLIADDRLKGRYFDIAHPRLVAEVKPGSNTLPPFELAD
jgi:hypothetical protein